MELITMAEIAERLGVSRQRVTVWRRESKINKFPVPAGTAERYGRERLVWRASEVDAWRAAFRPRQGGRRPARQGIAPSQSEFESQEGSTNMASIAERRKALKVSRKKVAEASGLTEAKVYRIEKETGRTTDDEKKLITDALDKLEAAAGDSDPS